MNELISRFIADWTSDISGYYQITAGSLFGAALVLIGAAITLSVYVTPKLDDPEGGKAASCACVVLAGFFLIFAIHDYGISQHPLAALRAK